MVCGKEKAMPHEILPLPTSALVAKTNHLADRTDADRYLLITPAGSPTWVDDPQEATPFASMREATRMAMRLPSTLRAYGLPREPELALRRVH
jgi:hypothetical protein